MVGSRRAQPVSPPVRLALCLAATVAQELAGRGAGALTVFEGDLTVDHDGLVPVGLLHPSPLAAREVIDDLADPMRPHVETLELVDDDVRRSALAENAAVTETGGMR